MKDFNVPTGLHYVYFSLYSLGIAPAELNNRTQPGLVRTTKLAVHLFTSLLTLLSNSGDIRVNGISDIAVLETIFLRLHNSLAEDLAILNPQWNDEVLYQETRKLVIGILQHITYNEWLPRFLGNSI